MLGNRLSQREFNKCMSERLRRARIDSGRSQKAMAAALGINLDQYKKYENRAGGQIPTYLIPGLCDILGFYSWFLLTGQAHEPKHMAHHLTKVS